MNLKNMLFRKGLYFLSIVAIGVSIVLLFVLPSLVQWYSENLATVTMVKEVIIFLYLTLIPLIFILMAVNRLSYGLLNDNCFTNKNLKHLNIITTCALIDFIIYFIGTIFIFKTAVCFVLTLATLLVATLSWVIKELITNGIEIKEEIDLTI